MPSASQIAVASSMPPVDVGAPSSSIGLRSLRSLAYLTAEKATLR